MLRPLGCTPGAVPLKKCIQGSHKINYMSERPCCTVKLSGRTYEILRWSGWGMVTTWSRVTWETSGRISRTCQWHDFEETVVTKIARFGTWISSGPWTQGGVMNQLRAWCSLSLMLSRAPGGDSSGFGVHWYHELQEDWWVRKDLNPTFEGRAEKDDLAESG